MQGDQEQVGWADKTSRSKWKNPQPSGDNQRKGSYQMSATIVEPGLDTQDKSFVQLYLSTCVWTVARKCMRKPQNLNAVDEFGSACEPNVYHLFT